MTALGLLEAPLERGRVDVLFVSLGTTLGLRTADDQLVSALRDAGLSVQVVSVPPKGRNVRTLMLTDFVQAWVAGVATRQALGYVEPGVILYSTTTAALLSRRPGVIRFDALAQQTRPGRHGLWQRPLERRRLRRAVALLPWDEASLDGAPAEAAKRAIVLPVAVDPPPTPQARARATDLAVAYGLEAGGLRAAAITYAADPRKKGLDRLLVAWAQARHHDELLLVTGKDALPDDLAGLPTEGVRFIGRLEPELFRALVAETGVLAVAPRREDYGLVQLDALAAGARVVTTASPGPYAALPAIRALWPEQVVDDADDPQALAAALRHAIDAPDDGDHARAAARAWSRESVWKLVAADVAAALRRPSAT